MAFNGRYKLSLHYKLYPQNKCAFINPRMALRYVLIFHFLAEVALPSGSRHNDGDGGDAHPGSGDYYNSLVAAVIVGAFILLALVVVTALYLRRTTTYKAIISGSGNDSSQGSTPSVSLCLRCRSGGFDCFPKLIFGASPVFTATP